MNYKQALASVLIITISSLQGMEKKELPLYPTYPTGSKYTVELETPLQATVDYQKKQLFFAFKDTDTMYKALIGHEKPETLIAYNTVATFKTKEKLGNNSFIITILTLEGLAHKNKDSIEAYKPVSINMPFCLTFESVNTQDSVTVYPVTQRWF